MRSRFNKYLKFKDYTPLELVEIFKRFCSNADYRISASAADQLLHNFSLLYSRKDNTFGNARLARNIFEQAISNQANRIVPLVDINEQILIRSTIEAEDLPPLP